MSAPAIGQLMPLLAFRAGERKTFTLVPVEAA